LLGAPGAYHLPSCPLETTPAIAGSPSDTLRAGSQPSDPIQDLREQVPGHGHLGHLERDRPGTPQADRAKARIDFLERTTGARRAAILCRAASELDAAGETAAACDLYRRIVAECPSTD
jgi:hypothetical protein